MAMTTPVVPSGRPSVVRWNSARQRWAMRQSSLMSPRWNRKYGRKDGLGQQCAEELHLLLVARRAEPPALARERQEVLTVPPALGGAALRATCGCLSHRAPAQIDSWAQWSQRTRAKPLAKSPHLMNLPATSGMIGRRNP